jgi:hypothetical protein
LYWQNTQYIFSIGNLLNPANTSTTHITTMTTIQPKPITILYFLNGRRVVLNYTTDNPDWREAVQTLNEQNMPFRLTYK